MKNKLLIAAAIMILAGLAGWFILGCQKPEPVSPWVKLADGSSVRVIGVSYGTNHVLGSKFAKMVSRLPPWGRDVLQTIFGQRIVRVQNFTTATPELGVWIDQQTNGAVTPSPPGDSYAIFLADSYHFASGDGMNTYSPPAFPSEIEGRGFPVFPRRERNITMAFFHYDSRGQGHFWTNISFPNPVFKKYPVWQAENLPATKRVGEIEVTLLSVETGHDNASSSSWKKKVWTTSYGTNRLDGRNYTLLDLRIKPLGNTNEVWRVEGLEISDATGNWSHSANMSWNGNDSQFEFMPGLWPGEAWKLKLFLKRTAGFRPNELFSFNNVPIGELDHTNILAWTTNVAGVSITLDSLCRHAPQTNGSWNSSLLSSARFSHSAVPSGTNMELVAAIFDGGKTNQSASSEGSDTYINYHFVDIPKAAKTAEFIFAIQQLRTVEFTVMPQLPKPELDAKQ